MVVVVLGGECEGVRVVVVGLGSRPASVVRASGQSGWVGVGSGRGCQAAERGARQGRLWGSGLGIRPRGSLSLGGMDTRSVVGCVGSAGRGNGRTGRGGRHGTRWFAAAAVSPA
jgi:hypothetical protein